MKTVTIFGASDDLIEIAGCEGADEFNATGSDLIMGIFALTSDNEAITIYAVYDGCWCFAIGAHEGEDYEYRTLPAWAIRRAWGIIDNDGSEYSEYLEIDVPDNTIITRRR